MSSIPSQTSVARPGGATSTDPSLFSTSATSLTATSLTSAAPSGSAASSSASDLSRSLASLASVLPSASGSGMNSTTPATNSTPGQPIVRTQVPIFACVPASYNITGGTLPYDAVFLIQSGDANNAKVLKNLPSENATGTFSWGVDIQPGTSVTFVVKDSLGQTGYSVPIVVQTSKDLFCLPKPNHTGAIVGGVLGGLAFLALLAGGVFWFFRRRRLEREAAARRAAGIASDEDEEYVEGNYGEVIKRSVSQRSRGQKSQISGASAAGSPIHERAAYFDAEEDPPNLDRSPSNRRGRDARPLPSTSNGSGTSPEMRPVPLRTPSTGATGGGTGGRFGTYNLAGLDYTPQSLDTIALSQPKPELPGYEEVTQGRRRPTVGQADRGDMTERR